jgi:ankyrin repeat protein
MNRPHTRGADLVDLVVEKVRAGASPLRIHDPRPLAREVIDRLAFADGAPLPPSLRRWLEFDASWLVRSIEMITSLDDPQLTDRPLAELAATQWDQQVAPFFAELAAVVPPRGAFLDRGCDSFRLLSTGAPDASGEYPVLCLDVDDSPLAMLETAGFDLWLASVAGVECDPAEVAADLADARRRLFGDGDHLEMMGAWVACDDHGRPVGALPAGDPDDEDYFDEPSAPADAVDEEPEYEEEEEEEEEEEVASACDAPTVPATPDEQAAGRLVEAIELGDRARITAALDDNRERFPTGSWRTRAVIAALRRDEDDLLAEVLAAGGDPDAHGRYGRALTLAARHGSAGKVRLLLAAGADARAADDDGDLPLNQAAENGHREVAELLLDAGASPRAEDENGRCALLEAAWHGQHDLVALLLERGADPNQAQEGNAAPIHCAVEQRAAETLDLLLAGGASPDARNWCGDTPLHIAFKHDLPDLARRLLAAGARRDVANHDGWTVDPLIDGRGIPRREVTVTYRASAEPQDVVIEIDLISWDRTYLAAELPQRLTAALGPLLAVAAAGGLGADRFDPSQGSAAASVVPSPALAEAVARHTLSWRFRMGGVAPAGLALMLAPFILYPLGESRIVRLTVTGSLPLDDSPDTVVVTGPDAAAHIAALASELRPWPAPPFAVEDAVASQPELELTFASAPARATSAAIDQLVRGWSEALPALPPREGEPLERFVLVQAKKPRGATQRWVIANPLPGQVEFPFSREAAVAIAIGVLAGAVARGADLRAVRLALPG